MSSVPPPEPTQPASGVPVPPEAAVPPYQGQPNGSGAPGYGAPGYGVAGYGAPGYGPGYGAPGYGPPTRTNPLSIVTLVLSLVGVSLVAVITGHISLSQIKKTAEQGHGLALAGLIIGYVGCGLWILGMLITLFAIVIPFLVLGTMGGDIGSAGMGSAALGSAA